MQQHNTLALEQYRSHYNAWLRKDSVYLDGTAKDTIQRIIREEWDPGYVAQMWCGHCVAKMLVYAFERMDTERTDTIKIKI